MSQSKLMQAQEKAKSLRSEVKELRGTVEELEQPNPSTLRQFVQIPIINGTAYASNFGYVKLQKVGLMPKRVPVDGIVGVVGQFIFAFAHGPVSSVFRDGFHGMTAGAAGRCGAVQAMETVETERGPAWLKPGQTTK